MKFKKPYSWKNRKFGQTGVAVSTKHIPQLLSALVKELLANCCFLPCSDTLSDRDCTICQGHRAWSGSTALLTQELLPLVCLPSPCTTRPPMTWPLSQSALSFSIGSACPAAALTNWNNIPKHLSCAFSLVTIKLLLPTRSFLKIWKY